MEEGFSRTSREQLSLRNPQFAHFSVKFACEAERQGSRIRHFHMNKLPRALAS